MTICHRFVRTSSVGQRQATLAITPRTTSSQPLLTTSLGSLCICLVFVFFCICIFVFVFVFVWNKVFTNTLLLLGWQFEFYNRLNAIHSTCQSVFSECWDPRDEEKRKGRHPTNLVVFTPLLSIALRHFCWNAFPKSLRPSILIRATPATLPIESNNKRRNIGTRSALLLKKEKNFVKPVWKSNYFLSEWNWTGFNY